MREMSSPLAEIERVSRGKVRRKATKISTTHIEIRNAARGNRHPRTRKTSSPQAEITISACGVFNICSRILEAPLYEWVVTRTRILCPKSGNPRFLLS